MANGALAMEGQKKWLMARPAEGLQDNQRLDQMWADGWWFSSLRLDVFGAYRPLRHQDYEAHWCGDTPKISELLA